MPFPAGSSTRLDAADQEGYVRDTPTAGVHWLGYNFYIVRGAVRSVQVVVNERLSARVEKQGPECVLAASKGTLYKAAADILNGRPVFAFLTLNADGSYRSLQLLSTAVTSDNAPQSTDTQGQPPSFRFTDPVIASPDLSWAQSRLPPGTALWINAFASAVGPRIPAEGEAQAAGEVIYYFVAIQGLPGICYFTSDGFTTSALRPLWEPVGTALAAYNFASLSATPVHLSDNGAGIALGGVGMDAHGKLAPRVAVFSVSSTRTVPVWYHVYEVVPNAFRNLDYQVMVRSFLNLCWGPSHTDGGMKAGSILSVFVWSPQSITLGEWWNVFAIQLDLVEPARSATAASLELRLSGADTDGWCCGRYQFGAFPVSFEAKSDARMKNGEPISGGQYICYFAYGHRKDDDELINWFLPSLLYSQKGPARNYKSLVENTMHPDAERAYVASWTLLGVITGLPPYDPALFALIDKVTVTFESTRGHATNNQVASDTTILIGGSAGAVNAQTSWVWGKKSSARTSWNLTFGQPISPPKNPALPGIGQTGSPLPAQVTRPAWWNRVGYLVIVTPVYKRAEYAIYNWDQVDTGLVMQVLWTVSGDQQIYSFDLTNPNQGPSDDGPADGPPALYSFPVDANGEALARWPLLDQLEQWTADPANDPRLGNVVPLLPDLRLGTISVSSANAFNETLNMADQQSATTRSENVIDVSANVKLCGIGFKHGLTIKRSQEVAIDYNHSVTISFSYPQLVAGQRRRINIQPYLLRANAHDLPWMPVLLGRQCPWILTWQVIPEAGHD